MEEKSNLSASSGNVDGKEVESFQSLIIEDVKYKTRLNKKFLNRKPYEPADPKKIQSFIPGTIRNIYCKKGKRVKAGEKLLELEAMKMVNTIFAEKDVTIKDILVKTGESVSKKQLLIEFK